jgi:hypothetical protein
MKHASCSAISGSLSRRHAGISPRIEIQHMDGKDAAEPARSEQIATLRGRRRAQNMTGFRLNDISLAKEHHVQSPSSERRRDLQFASDVVAHGPLYALANFRIHSPDALVGQENWEYWTKPKSKETLENTG